MTSLASRRVLPETAVEWARATPFFLMHLAPFGVLATGVRAADLALCAGLYVGRMFFITAGYHRYFSHRSYKLDRLTQFLMAVGGSTAAQKGVLWWAAHHRAHHQFSDTDRDIHSPRHGFWWAHMGWILSSRYDATDFRRIADFAKYPELVWLNRYHLLPAVALGVVVLLSGGPSALFAGFFLSTVLLYHGTFSINSLAHLWGSRRYATRDTSRNSLWLALLTLGEGWHNNHHHYRSSARQGFYWWEVDISFYLLTLMSWIGLARDLRSPPQRVLSRGVAAPASVRVKGAARPTSSPPPQKSLRY